MFIKERLLIAVVFAVLLLPCAALAQISISVSGGYGSWSMKTMKAWQKNYRQSLPVEARTLADYPDHFFFEGAVTQQRTNWIRGLAFTMGASGGRVYYSDYSGTISLDQDLSFYALSGIIGKNLNADTEKILVVASVRPGLMLSKMSYDFAQVIYDGESESLTNGFSSYNVTVQPGISVVRKFGRVGIEVQAGYLLSIVSGKLTYDDKTKIPAGQRNVDYLIYGEQTPVKANWSGYRIGLGISFQLR